MNLRTVVVAGLAVSFGGSAATGVHMLSSRATQQTLAEPKRPIVVAATEIPRGAVVKAESLKLIQWPVNAVPPGAITKLEDAVGRILSASIALGEPVLAVKLGENGVGAATLVKPGMRAYTIHTPTLSAGVAGFVLPGNRVDVLLTVTKACSEDGTGGGITSTLLQNVEVLATDSRLEQSGQKNEEPGKQGLRSVTLLVTPQMAAQLSLAQTAGTLHLSLRNDTDASIAATAPVTLAELRYQEDAVPSEQKTGNSSVEEVATTAQAACVPGRERASPLTIRTLRGNLPGTIYVSGGE